MDSLSKEDIEKLRADKAEKLLNNQIVIKKQENEEIGDTTF